MTVTSMPPKQDDATEEKKGGRKKLVIAAVLVLALCAGGWYFFLKPSAEPSEPVPGEVMALEGTQLNLAGGHYLRLGLALQLSADAHEAEGSKALDAAISLFSGLEVADLTRAEQREELREKLMERLDEAYHGEVIDVYYTEFVTQ